MFLHSTRLQLVADTVYGRGLCLYLFARSNANVAVSKQIEISTAVLRSSGEVWNKQGWIGPSSSLWRLEFRTSVLSQYEK
ncbi:MAG TPA: hypothetical protein VNA15_05030 [Candidatus Angelobacter sp.]|nr:hypothetical protein [Candidatus Angelobacter sp.]